MSRLARIGPWVYPVIAGVAAGAGCWFTWPTARTGGRPLLTVCVAGLLWLASHALHRARPYLTEDWKEDQEARDVQKWVSFSPDDYGPIGRRWVLVFWTSFALMAIVWLMPFVLAVFSG